jgi:hypothetical protein
LLDVEGMWYSPESILALASLVLLSPGEPVRTPSVLPAVAARASRVAACDAPAPSLPDSIALPPGLEPLVRSWLEHSPAFRRQCRELAAAPRLRATVRVTARPAGSTFRAITSFRQNRSGELVAQIEIRSAPDMTELLAHELEHVLEQLEGLDLDALAEGGGARRVSDGAFETARAVQAGHRVAAEVVNNAPDRFRSTGASLWRSLRRAVSGDRRVAPAGGPASAHAR